MKCVYYDHKAPTDFEEHLSFSVEMPYTIRIKHFLSEDIVPLHYGKTIEILICHNLTGKLLIQNNIYKLGGNQVFVIPPYTVHSNEISCCDGIQYVVKISFSDMEHYINIIELLNASSISFSQIAYVCPFYDDIASLVEDMIREDGNLIHCSYCLIKLFEILCQFRNQDYFSLNDSVLSNESDVHRLIEWTQQNFKNKITLEDAAKISGYSKNYFCNRFRALTGTSYFNFLISVRIDYACMLLKKGASVAEACYNSGFEDVSYFINAFKKIHKITPKQYSQRFKALTSNSPDSFDSSTDLTFT